MIRGDLQQKYRHIKYISIYSKKGVLQKCTGVVKTMVLP